MLRRFNIIAGLTALTLAASGQVVHAKDTCSETNLGAEYVRTVTAAGDHGHEKSKPQAKSTLKLWRLGEEVLHEFPDTQVANKWNLVRNGKLKLTRYFDPYERAIEYQPSDMNGGKGFTDWEVRYQLISSSYLTGLEKVGTTGTGCQVTERYEGTLNGDVVSLAWMPKLKLLKRFERRSAQGVEVTEMTALHTKLNNVAHKRDHFKEFSFADIGDNETDPFLSKLINIGFIEHGASGIYDAQGRPMAGPDGHGGGHSGGNHNH